MRSKRAGRGWIGLALAGVCLAGGSAVATAGDSPSAAPDPAPETAASRLEPVTAVQPELAETIGELERPRTDDDEMPPAWRDAVADRSGAAGNWGANPDLSRRSAPGVWIVPGDGHVCLANATPGEGALGFGCATTADAARGLLAPSDLDEAGKGVLTGVVPDGVSEVTLLDRDGATRTAAVARNTYQAAVTADLSEVRFTDVRGVEHVLPMAWRP